MPGMDPLMALRRVHQQQYMNPGPQLDPWEDYVDETAEIAEAPEMGLGVEAEESPVLQALRRLRG